MMNKIIKITASVLTALLFFAMIIIANILIHSYAPMWFRWVFNGVVFAGSIAILSCWIYQILAGESNKAANGSYISGYNQAIDDVENLIIDHEEEIWIGVITDIKNLKK